MNILTTNTKYQNVRIYVTPFIWLKLYNYIYIYISFVLFSSSEPFNLMIIV